MLRTPEQILVGKIVATQGLHGEMRVQPFTDFPERFATTKELTARHASGRTLLLHPESSYLKGNLVILRCKEIDSIEAVRPWLNAELSISATELWPLTEGRFYIFQILGLEVYTDTGLHLGTVSDVLTTAANDVYVVTLSPEASKLAEESDGITVLLPVIDDVILATDLAAGRLTVHLMPGLL